MLSRVKGMAPVISIGLKLEYFWNIEDSGCKLRNNVNLIVLSPISMFDLKLLNVKGLLDGL